MLHVGGDLAQLATLLGSAEKDESIQFHRRFEGFSNVSGLSLRNMMLRSNTIINRQLR